jgi:hypothetical protein
MSSRRNLSATKDAAGRSDWRFAIRALRHRNYLLFFSGQTVSLIGTWMTRIATSWLVYRLTKSAFLLGLVGFSGQIPVFLLGPRTSKRRERKTKRTHRRTGRVSST